MQDDLSKGRGGVLDQEIEGMSIVVSGPVTLDGTLFIDSPGIPKVGTTYKILQLHPVI
jgi:hypothetical protein